MQDVILYRYADGQGGAIVSPEMPDGEYSALHRLIADDGCMLTDGNTVCECVDTDNPENWAEIPNDSAYAEAGKILMGVSE